MRELLFIFLFALFIIKKGKCNSNNLNPNAILNPKIIIIIIIIIERLIKEERLRARLTHVFKHMFSVFK